MCHAFEKNCLVEELLWMVLGRLWITLSNRDSILLRVFQTAILTVVILKYHLLFIWQSVSSIKISCEVCATGLFSFILKEAHIAKKWQFRVPIVKIDSSMAIL